MSNCLVSRKDAIKYQVPQVVPKETTRHQRDCLREDPCTGTLGLNWGTPRGANKDNSPFRINSVVTPAVVGLIMIARHTEVIKEEFRRRGE